MIVMRCAVICLSVLVSLGLGVWMPCVMKAQTNHVPLTIQRQRVIQSCGAALVTKHPSTRFSLSTIVGLPTVGTTSSERHQAHLGFWVPLSVVTLIDDNVDIVTGARPHVWPNPFTNQLTIDIRQQHIERLRASVYDMRGKHVATLSNSESDTDGARLYWDGIDMNGNSVPTGTYVLRVFLKQYFNNQESLFSSIVSCSR